MLSLKKIVLMGYGINVMFLCFGKTAETTGPAEITTFSSYKNNSETTVIQMNKQNSISKSSAYQASSTATEKSSNSIFSTQSQINSFTSQSSVQSANKNFSFISFAPQASTQSANTKFSSIPPATQDPSHTAIGHFSSISSAPQDPSHTATNHSSSSFSVTLPHAVNNTSSSTLSTSQDPSHAANDHSSSTNKQNSISKSSAYQTSSIATEKSSNSIFSTQSQLNSFASQNSTQSTNKNFSSISSAPQAPTQSANMKFSSIPPATQNPSHTAIGHFSSISSAPQDPSHTATNHSSSSFSGTPIVPHAVNNTSSSILSASQDPFHAATNHSSLIFSVTPNPSHAVNNKTSSTNSPTRSSESISVLKRDNVPVKVPLVVSIEKKFNPSLLDKTSKVFKEYKTEFKNKLEGLYMTVTNFLRVEIIGFREGSTECDFAVILKPGSIIKNGSNESVDLQKKTDELNKTEIFNFTMTTYNSSIVSGFQTLKNSSSCYIVDCGKGYICGNADKSFVTCKHICTTENKCQNGGECLHDDRHDVPLCRCKSDSQYVYSGAHCEVKSEKFGMSKTNIIAIAAGTGAGVVVILLGVIVILIVRHRRTKTHKDRDDKSDHSKSVSMEELRYDKGNNTRSSDGFLHRPKVHAVENVYQSGLPVTKYVQGREHKVMKDDSGKETYIYPPADYMLSVSRSRAVSSYSTYPPEQQDCYDLDTNSKFEIQRPNLDPWYLNNY